MAEFNLSRHHIDEMVMGHEPMEPAHNRAYNETQNALSALNALVTAEVDKIHDRLLPAYREGMKHGIRLFLHREVYASPSLKKPGYLRVSVGDLTSTEIPVLSDCAEETEYFTLTQEQRDAWVAGLMKQVDHALIVEGSERHRKLDPMHPIFRKA